MTVFGALLLQRLRRDVVQLAVWVAAGALLAYGSAAGVADAFSTAQERSSLLALALANPVILIFRGLPSGADEGAFLVFLVLPFLALLASLMAAFLAVRHTRAEEETDRADLVAATGAGRALPLWATLTHGVIACTALGGAVGLALAASGLPGMGSATAGASVAATGVVFLAVALLSAQVVRSARAARSIAVGAITALFVLAGVGNALGTPSDDLTRMTSSALAWISPFGWAENTRAFDEDALWPLCIALGATAVLVAAAGALHAGRDLGAGLVPARPGRADASPMLSSPLGLVWRLSGGSLLAWTVGAAIVGALATSLGSVVEQVATGNPTVTAMLERLAAAGSMDTGILITFFVMVGVLAACFGVQTVQRARHEESLGTAEPTLAAAVHRSRWLGSFLLVAVVGIVIIVAAAVAAAGVALWASGGDASLFRDAVITGAGQVAAASVFAAVTAVVFAALPRATIVAGWSAVLASACLALFGTIFGLDDDLVSLSPFAAVPLPTDTGMDLHGGARLVGIAIVGAAGALVLMGRRELAAE
ncbi:hypothetical protein QL996_14405 [Planococcus sp. APC 4015]|nr:hypothetical protein [Planococcus sp. APC 4015]